VNLAYASEACPRLLTGAFPSNVASKLEGRDQRKLSRVDDAELLTNIMLTPLEQTLESRDLRMARYADDFLIVVKKRREAERVVTDVTPFARLHNLQVSWIAYHYPEQRTPTTEVSGNLKRNGNTSEPPCTAVSGRRLGEG
jgi:hypothetical protein